nr:MAG TPA: hypothetical protein [Caudoviricetes sp.]
MDSLIRWKKGDYIKLGQAVSRFNKIINELDVDEKKYLPDLKDYKELRDHINSRKELNRIINSLKRANIENLQEVHAFDSGEQVSKWEFSEIKKAKRRALLNLEKERKTILTSRESIGMGDERLSEIKAIETSFEKLDERTGSDFERLKTRIFSIGKSDYKLTKDVQFRENFYMALEGISNFQNYEVLKRELDKIKNPTKFYEYVKKSPVLMDLFLWYKESDSLFYGGFNDNEDAFDSTLLFHLGITDVNV